MTVAELIRELNGCLPDAKVFCDYDGISSEIHNVIYGARETDFSDDEGSEEGYIIEHEWS